MKRDTPTRRAHRIAEQLISAWLARGEPENGCTCDGEGCATCSELRVALDKLAQQHFVRGDLS